METTCQMCNWWENWQIRCHLIWIRRQKATFTAPFWLSGDGLAFSHQLSGCESQPNDRNHANVFSFKIGFFVIFSGPGSGAKERKVLLDKSRIVGKQIRHRAVANNIANGCTDRSSMWRFKVWYILKSELARFQSDCSQKLLWANFDILFKLCRRFYLPTYLSTTCPFYGKASEKRKIKPLHSSVFENVNVIW